MIEHLDSALVNSLRYNLVRQYERHADMSAHPEAYKRPLVVGSTKHFLNEMLLHCRELLPEDAGEDTVGWYTHDLLLSGTNNGYVSVFEHQSPGQVALEYLALTGKGYIDDLMPVYERSQYVGRSQDFMADHQIVAAKFQSDTDGLARIAMTRCLPLYKEYLDAIFGAVTRADNRAGIKLSNFVEQLAAQGVQPLSPDEFHAYIVMVCDELRATNPVHFDPATYRFIGQS